MSTRTNSRAPSLLQTSPNSPSAQNFNEKATSFVNGQAPPVRQRWRRFKSHRLIGEPELPWLEQEDPRERFPSYIFYGMILLGFGISFGLIYKQWVDVRINDYCLAMEDDFKTFDKANWGHAIQIDGFESQSFQWATDDEKNSYVDSEGLHLKATLTTESTSITPEQLYNGYTLNLTTAGTCTSAKVNQSCAIISNFTTGATIPPVRSARVTTEGRHAIKYGKVEVVAKMAKGDWLWPGIKMLPVDGGAYGAWPKSGQISIADVRGNDKKAYASVGGIDTMLSSIHWGMSLLSDHTWLTQDKRQILRTDYSQGFHTYGVEWTENYILTYVDSRLFQVLAFTFKKDKTMWKLGEFAFGSEAGQKYNDVWSQTGKPNTPFDQNFYLVLDLAVGSRTGFFPDDKGNKGAKPWIDSAPSAARDFSLASNSWYPTWDKEGMVVKSVKMWNLGKC